MIKHFVFISTLFLLFLGMGNAQTADEAVLFTVEGVPVTVSEFNYIYTKTNGPKADFSRHSLDEYLKLYVNFKLKVQKARDMKLDTIPTLQRELEGYRKQLADSYLIDKEVTENLVREAYEHQLQDVNISHILVRIEEDAAPKDTLVAYTKISKAMKALEAGTPWDSVAVNFSEDKAAKSNYGNVGYVTALFPNGLYEMEKAAYQGKVGAIQGPIRTKMGYHLLKVNDRRPARGEVEVAHILIRNPKEDETKDSEAIIRQIYQELENGADFDALAKERSEDKRTSAKGGYVGTFGINRYEKAFEDAAFGLENKGDYSEPIQTAAGWHILKLIKKRPIPDFPIARTGLQAKIKQDTRFEAAKQAMIKRIQKDNDFKEYNTTLSNYIDTLPKEFLTYKWKAPVEGSKEPLFSFGKDYLVTLGDFTDFLGRSTRKRVRMSTRYSPEKALRTLYTEFVDSETMKYEEQQLDQKYPEFKALMREYEEGILLFEASKINVWDQAAQDTAGLEKFFETLDGKYRWKERAVVSIYLLRSSDEGTVEKVKKYAVKNTPEAVIEKFNSGENPLLVRSEKIMEKGRHQALRTVDWEVNALSETEYNKGANTATFLKIEEILPEAEKSLDEARGYVIADYQDYLERRWINQLKQEYKVEVNEDVFASLIKN
jgi:peptidyl-prolyl cis-trans isomerase SurA